MTDFRLAPLTTVDFAALVDDPHPLAILQPVGSVEPHGPHMSLLTDTVISDGACARAAAMLAKQGILARVAPAIPYGVTRCAAAFAGAVTVAPEALTAFLRSVIDGYLRTGADHVCLVNNHLEPAQDRAVRAAIEGVAAGRASVACPLSRRWARTLSAEFKSGACHAGRYETSMVMAQAPELVDDEVRAGLAEVPISLSEKLGAGIGDFAEMGLANAYAGAPARATAAEGEEQLALLATMVATEVSEALAAVQP